LSTADIKTLLDIAGGSSRLSEAEGLKLFDVPLQVLGQAAHAVRKRLNNTDEVTYLVDRNINYTNICAVRCDFCAFSRDAGDEDAYVLSFEELDRKLDETVSEGGSGILLQGGCNPDFDVDFLCGMFSHIKSRHSGLRIHALSPPEIVFLSKRENVGISDLLLTLITAGLDSLPGGGAEILVDEVREKISPLKCTSGEWLDVMRAAHELNLKTTATMMFGHVESRADRIEHLRKIRSLQEETGGFVALIPWTFQPGGSKLGETIEPATGVEYLRTLAISRLYLDNIRHIGASWLTQGTRLGQVALHFGGDDIGSVMLEENVVAAAGCRNRTTEDELRHIINDAGFTPRKRDAVYNYVDNS